MDAVNRLDGSPSSDELNLHDRSGRHTPSSSSSDRRSEKTSDSPDFNEGFPSPGDEKKVSILV